MHRRIPWLLVLAVCLTFPAHAAPPEIPEALKPWINWVLQDNRDYRCPFLYNGFENKRCGWPSAAKLDLQAQQGHFAAEWTLYAESWVQLPGDAQHWPQQVTSNGKPALVLERNGFPALYLEAGKYHINGDFFWDNLPESLALPPDSGLITLTVQGQEVTMPNFKDGQLWIKQNETEAHAAAGVENSVAIQVFRHIIDDVPLQITTRIEIDVSGLQRELKLPSPLLDGFIPLQLQSPLPARLEANGELLLQVRPGHWEIELLARHPRELQQVALPTLPAPWPEEEVWVFEARPYQRVVEVKNLPAIDPQQTNLPEDWRVWPAYRLNAGAIMQFTLIRRGDTDPEPNQLSLQRRLWLDFDGGGYTVNDQISGTMTQGWRLTALPELQLGQAQLDGTGQLITRLPGTQDAGVEVRNGTIRLSADSRLPGSASHLSATGWQQQFQQISAELNLPPGWRLLGASGVDNVPDSWISRWTLLDLFVVLIAALAVGRLWHWQWGCFALVTLSLLWHEPGAPRYIWLHLLAAAALLQVLPEGKFCTAVKWYRNACWLVLLWLAIPFMVEQVRTGLYPQLEHPYQPVQPATYENAAIAPAAQAPMPSAPAEMDSTMAMSEEVAGSLESKARALPRKMLRGSAAFLNKVEQAPAMADFERSDPNANIQTGPGLPQWHWKKIALSWNGPVDSGQQIHFWLLSPFWSCILNVLRVSLLTALGLLLLGVIKRQDRLSWPPALNTIVLLPLLWLPPAPAHADYPDQALLDALKQRLLQAPDCLPQCAQLSLLQVRIDSASLRLELQLHSRENTAVPLPAQAEQWLPNEVTVDGSIADGLYRDEQGLLWLYLPPGRHNIAMHGRLLAAQKFSLPLPLPAHRVTVVAKDWQVDGVHEHGIADAQLQFTRIADANATAQPQTALEATVLPPFASVERTLQLGLDWQVQTRVVRLSPPDTAIVLEVPLLDGEAVTTADIRVKDRKVLVNMPPQQSEIAWESALEKSARIELNALDTQQWVEVWRADAGPVWHLQSTGLTAVHQANPQGAWLPEWRPWPGEKLSLQLNRPEAVPGPTLTIDSSDLQLSPGKRLLEAALTLVLRSSKGGQHGITLPESTELQTVAIDGANQPLRLKGRQLLLPLKPGTQNVHVVWRQNQGVAVLLHNPVVDLGMASVNSHTRVNLSQDRWTLWVSGPRLGPAVLFWGLLAVLALLAFGLGRIDWTPLKSWQWFLLLLGLSQIPLTSAFLVAGWLLLLGLRARQPSANPRVFNFAQCCLGLLTVMALVLLFTAVKQGLLGLPAMQIGGNQSTAWQLHWFQDRAGAALPGIAVLSVPLIVYRLLMLAWSLWLAAALLDWLKWGWSCFASGGLWQKIPPQPKPPATDAKSLPEKPSA